MTDKSATSIFVPSVDLTVLGDGLDPMPKGFTIRGRWDRQLFRDGKLLGSVLEVQHLLAEGYRVFYRADD